MVAMLPRSTIKARPLAGAAIGLAMLGVVSLEPARGQSRDSAENSASENLPRDPFEVLPYRPTGECFRLWRDYIAAPRPKAFAVTREKKPLIFYLYPSHYDHYCGYDSAAISRQDAVDGAIKYCEDRFTNAECVVFAIDDKIVFAPETR